MASFRLKGKLQDFSRGVSGLLTGYLCLVCGDFTSFAEDLASLDFTRINISEYRLGCFRNCCVYSLLPYLVSGLGDNVCVEREDIDTTTPNTCSQWQPWVARVARMLPVYLSMKLHTP